MSLIINAGKKFIPKYHYGLSGIVLPIPKYKFPEEMQTYSRLQYYSTFFNSIEINSTFYKIPKSSTVKRWVSEVDDSFRFTFKVWQEVTHKKPFDFREEDVRRFIDTVSYIENKAACLLLQFPPSFKSHNIDGVERLLSCIASIDTSKKWRIALEFRDSSWYQDDVYEMLDHFKMGLVIHDKSSGPTPMVTCSTDFVYVRFHGPSGNYKSSYTDAFLDEYASYISSWLEIGKNVYVYFNNTAGNAFANSNKLNQLVAGLWNDIYCRIFVS